MSNLALHTKLHVCPVEFFVLFCSPDSKLQSPGRCDNIEQANQTHTLGLLNYSSHPTADHLRKREIEGH